MKILIVIWCILVFLSISEGRAKGKKKNKNDDGKYQCGPTFKKYRKLFKTKGYYTVNELAFREKIVNENAARVEKHNIKTNTSYHLGLNEYSDMSPVEFTKTVCGTHPPKEMRALPRWTKPELPAGAIPKFVDWRPVMQPIKNQGTCGSCWSFSTAAVIEGQLKRKHPDFNHYLSRQQLIECSSQDNGCDGGWPEYTLKWIKKSGNKMALEEEYPYTAEHHLGNHTLPTCRASNSTVDVCIVDIFTFPIRSEELLERYLYFYGPIAISMKVHESNGKFQNYKDGIFHDSECPKTVKGGKHQCADCNHAMVVVGYGEEDGKLYWIVRNSWGETWGEKGYAKMIRRSNNNCNVACWMVLPVINC